MLTNPYLVALGIPLLLMLCSALAKKLVRGAGWKMTDFFLGVELSLAALGSSMVYFYDLQKEQSGTNVIEAGASIASKIGTTATFAAVCFFLLLVVLSNHQDWEPRSTNPRGQLFMLGVVSNLIGVALFAGFVLLVKGI
jgi:phosphatidylglycerophosphate synthase